MQRTPAPPPPASALTLRDLESAGSGSQVLKSLLSKDAKQHAEACALVSAHPRAAIQLLQNSAEDLKLTDRQRADVADEVLALGGESSEVEQMVADSLTPEAQAELFRARGDLPSVLQAFMTPSGLALALAKIFLEAPPRAKHEVEPDDEEEETEEEEAPEDGHEEEVQVLHEHDDRSRDVTDEIMAWAARAKERSDYDDLLAVVDGFGFRMVTLASWRSAGRPSPSESSGELTQSCGEAGIDPVDARAVLVTLHREAIDDPEALRYPARTVVEAYVAAMRRETASAEGARQTTRGGQTDAKKLVSDVGF